MRLKRLHVTNYRGLRNVEIPLSSFTCLIGKNNSGKSSILQCLSLVRSGTKLKESDFFDPAEQVRIALTLSGVDGVDLARVANEEHRSRFADLIRDGDITVVRVYDPATLKSALLVSRQVPNDEGLRATAVRDAIKGKTGGDRVAAVSALSPAFAETLQSTDGVEAIIAKHAAFVAGLAPEELTESDEPLPTGLDRSLDPLLPEFVYIPAVKDVSDEIKTAESASFGKLLRILFDQIEDQFSDLADQFATLQRKLSRVSGPGGEEVDERLPEVQLIEATIEKFVKQNFPNVEILLSVPAPELRAVLNSAELSADDGHLGPVTAKGDGLKRAIAFAVLQAYAELSSGGGASAEERPPYVLLFEEPELYLHPSAQSQLFRALEVFGSSQSVVVTTHSPLFFDPASTKTFVKVYKPNAESGATPATLVHVVDVTDVAARDQLQLIVHENNNAALFSERVVLIEGDSDYVVLPHLLCIVAGERADQLNDVTFVRVGGKGSFLRYREFFSRFGIDAVVVADLDAVIESFDKLSPSAEDMARREHLLQCLDGLEDEIEPPNGERLRALLNRGPLRQRWRDFDELRTQWLEEGDEALLPQLSDSLAALFEKLDGPRRYALLRDSTDETAVALKRALVDGLRANGVHVLFEGCLEDYYEGADAPSDKVAAAVAFQGSCLELSDVPHPEEFELLLDLVLGYSSVASGAQDPA